MSTDDLVQRMDQVIDKNPRYTISGLSDFFFTDISRLAFYIIVSERLKHCKLCARWVPRILFDHRKTQRMGAALTFLQRCNHDGDAFLNIFNRRHETWVHCETEEMKEQSKKWMHSNSSSYKPVKFMRMFFTKKYMVTMFWDRKGVLLVEFMPLGTTITAALYSVTL